MQKMRDAAPEASVDRRLVATMLSSFFRARESARKQTEILGLIAKVLDDANLVALGTPQSLAGKAGSLLGSLWGAGGGGGGAHAAGGGGVDAAATFGDLWMEFLVKEAGGMQQQQPQQPQQAQQPQSTQQAPTQAPTQLQQQTREATAQPQQLGGDGAASGSFVRVGEGALRRPDDGVATAGGGVAGDRPRN